MIPDASFTVWVTRPVLKQYGLERFDKHIEAVQKA